MDFNHLGIQILIILATMALLWLLLKTLKVIWKLTFIFLIFLVLSFALPAVRQWIFNLF